MRRKHNYLPLIMELLKTLANEGKLVEAVNKQVQKLDLKAKAKNVGPK